MTESAVGAAFFTTWRKTPRSMRPFARSEVTNSWLRISATSARTVREMMPIGITDSVIAGRIMKRKCSQSNREPLPGPAPTAGSQPSRTEKMMTSTMPRQ